MKLEQIIAGIDDQIKRLQITRANVVMVGDKLAHIPGLDIVAWQNYVDINNPTREQSVEVIKALGVGKWQKSASFVAGKIDYVNTTFLPDTNIRLWSSEPPPSCKLVEYDELIPETVIPAHTEKKFKMVCGPEPDTAIETSETQPANNNEQRAATTDTATESPAQF